MKDKTGKGYNLARSKKATHFDVGQVVMWMVVLAEAGTTMLSRRIGLTTKEGGGSPWLLT